MNKQKTNIMENQIKIDDLEVGNQFMYKGVRYRVSNKDYTFVIAKTVPFDGFKHYFVRESHINAEKLSVWN